MEVNSVVLAGTVAKPPGLVYRRDGTPVLKFVVVTKDANERLGKTFTTAIPAELVGERAEALGSVLAAGDVVLIQGRLSYRALAEQAGGTLGVWCRAVQRLGGERVAEDPEVPF